MLIEGGHPVQIRKSACANGETFEYELVVGDTFKRGTAVGQVIARTFATPDDGESELEAIRQLFRNI